MHEFSVGDLGNKCLRRSTENIDVSGRVIYHMPSVVDELCSLRLKVREATKEAMRIAKEYEEASHYDALRNIVEGWISDGISGDCIVAFACAAELKLSINPLLVERCCTFANQSKNRALRSLYWASWRRIQSDGKIRANAFYI